jgi:hypothetical protein
LVSGQTVPSQCLCKVLGDPSAVRKANSEIQLRGWSVSTSRPRQQQLQSPHILLGWNIKYCTACGAIRYTTLCQALLATAAKDLPAAVAHPRPLASIVLGI